MMENIIVNSYQKVQQKIENHLYWLYRKSFFTELHPSCCHSNTSISDKSSHTSKTTSSNIRIFSTYPSFPLAHLRQDTDNKLAIESLRSNWPRSTAGAPPSEFSFLIAPPKDHPAPDDVLSDIEREWKRTSFSPETIAVRCVGSFPRPQRSRI